MFSHVLYTNLCSFELYFEVTIRCAEMCYPERYWLEDYRVIASVRIIPPFNRGNVVSAYVTYDVMNVMFE